MLEYRMFRVANKRLWSKEREIPMSKPVVANKKPEKIALEKDENHFYCTCWKSNSQPFCDGSHRGTSLKPMKFAARETSAAFLCQWK